MLNSIDTSIYFASDLFYLCVPVPIPILFVDLIILCHEQEQHMATHICNRLYLDLYEKKFYGVEKKTLSIMAQNLNCENNNKLTIFRFFDSLLRFRKNVLYNNTNKSAVLLNTFLYITVCS